MASVDHSAALVRKLEDKLEDTAVCPSYDMDTLWEAFNQSPKDVQLKVYGFVPLPPGMDDELIQTLMEAECISLGKLGKSKSIKLETRVRLSMLSFLQTFNCETRVMCYLHAVQLFDLGSQLFLGSDSSLSSVMALAAAAWMVSAKLISGEGPHYSIEQIVAHAENFAGFPVMTCGDVQEKEMTFLLNFNICAPTVSTWYDLFSARLDAILNGALERSAHLQQLQRTYLDVLTMAMYTLEISKNYPANMMATGSFCFALAVTGLVPMAEVIDPSSIDSTQMPDMASMEVQMSAWLSRGFCAKSQASPLPGPAVLAAAQVAVHSSPESMRFATTMLVAHLRTPSEILAGCAETRS